MDLRGPTSERREGKKEGQGRGGDLLLRRGRQERGEEG